MSRSPEKPAETTRSTVKAGPVKMKRSAADEKISAVGRQDNRS
jgi:hypothetical protein